MKLVPLADARDEARFGGKAVQLGAALRGGIAVPAGVAASVELVAACAAGDAAACAEIARAVELLGAPLVARSSAVGEDGAAASHAGQHATVLNVLDGTSLVEAVTAVHASAWLPSALAYRARLGMPGAAPMAVVIQRIVDADVAGVLFSRCPVTGRDERLIEAAWGLGEAVVAGLVTPDNFRVARGGAVTARRAGLKDLEIRPTPGGGVEEREVPDARARALCLDDGRLRRLEELAMRCEVLFGGAQDLEWAFAGDELLLLQRRPVTR